MLMRADEAVDADAGAADAGGADEADDGAGEAGAGGAAGDAALVRTYGAFDENSILVKLLSTPPTQ